MNSLRLEGQKTAAIEICQQFDWQVWCWRFAALGFGPQPGPPPLMISQSSYAHISWRSFCSCNGNIHACCFSRGILPCNVMYFWLAAGAGLGHHPGRQPGQHLRLLQGLQDVQGPGADRPAAAPGVRAGSQRQPAVPGVPEGKLLRAPLLHERPFSICFAEKVFTKKVTAGWPCMPRLCTLMRAVCTSCQFLSSLLAAAGLGALWAGQGEDDVRERHPDRGPGVHQPRDPGAGGDGRHRGGGYRGGAHGRRRPRRPHRHVQLPAHRCAWGVSILWLNGMGAAPTSSACSTARTRVRPPRLLCFLIICACWGACGQLAHLQSGSATLM